MENEKNVVGVYRVLYLVKNKDGVQPRVSFVCSAVPDIDKALKALVDDPDVVRLSREPMLYFDCNDIGKIDWLKNEFIEKKEGE